MADVEIISAARDTLRQALALDWPHLTVTPEVETWMLGQVWSESRFGSTPDWGTSNNWGAVTFHIPAWGFIEHGDHDANGHPVTYKFQSYPSQLEACRDWLHVLLRHDVPAALGKSVRDVCAAMYRNGYYTGVSGSADERIDAYVAFSSAGAAHVRAMLAVADGAPDVTTTAGVQAALSRLGFDPGPIDGVPGPKTTAAIEAFQRDRGLEVDGKVGPQTQAALLDPSQLAYVSQSDPTIRIIHPDVPLKPTDDEPPSAA